MKYFLILFSFVLLSLTACDNKTTKLYSGIDAYMNNRSHEFDQISDERKAQLEELSDFISGKIKNNEEINLTFICTHNSRRSHMAQLWAWAAAEYYGIEKVNSFSGGTEATAFNPRAVKAVKKAGFKIEKADEEDNPRYATRYHDDVKPVTSFSKKFSDESNPQENFAAVMVCSDADEACPIVNGADSRIAIPYEDPKAFDGTDKEEFAYDERCAQISREMLYVFSKVEK
jgi:arsenate reductase